MNRCARLHTTAAGSLIGLVLAATLPLVATAQSLRFYNDGNLDADLIQRVRIVIGADRQPSDLQTPLDLGDPADSADGSFTIEFWLRANAGDNPRGSGCEGGAPIDWIACPIVVDRDINGSGEFGKYGLSICNDGTIRAGFERVSPVGGVLVCTAPTNAYDGSWHHIAFTRDGTTGEACLYLDGVQRDCAAGIGGAISYDDTRAPTSPSGQDPTLVLAAEKHGFIWDGFTGWLDEFRFSDVVRYTPCGAGSSCFVVPTAPFVSDPNTVGLFHFDEGAPGTICSCAGPLLPLLGAGTCVTDSSSFARHAECRFGLTGSDGGPVYSASSPFTVDVPGLSPVGAAAVASALVVLFALRVARGSQRRPSALTRSSTRPRP